jgi:hypothetical protein
VGREKLAGQKKNKCQGGDTAEIHVVMATL